MTGFVDCRNRQYTNNTTIYLIVNLQKNLVLRPIAAIFVLERNLIELLNARRF